MFSTMPERRMHIVRWVLTVSWLVLITSLFSGYVNLLSSLQWLYPIAPTIFWAWVIPGAIMILLVLGHEAWRRICPLYFLSQITRSLKLSRDKEIHPWLVKNHIYLQFGLLFLGLNCRLLLINSNQLALGSFLVLTILSAILVVYLYGGRSWCHYVCPFGIVQKILVGPQGLLGSKAHKTSKNLTSQSMCRTFNKNTGKEEIACVGCKSPCMDIDAEKAYWIELNGAHK